jgi:hypothetical protein
MNLFRPLEKRRRLFHLCGRRPSRGLAARQPCCQRQAEAWQLVSLAVSVKRAGRSKLRMASSRRPVGCSTPETKRRLESTTSNALTGVLTVRRLPWLVRITKSLVTGSDGDDGIERLKNSTSNARTFGIVSQNRSKTNSMSWPTARTGQRRFFRLIYIKGQLVPFIPTITVWLPSYKLYRIQPPKRDDRSAVADCQTSTMLLLCPRRLRVAI